MTGFDFSNHVTMLLDLQIVAVKVNSFIQESFFHSSQIISNSDAIPSILRKRIEKMRVPTHQRRKLLNFSFRVSIGIEPRIAASYTDTTHTLPHPFLFYHNFKRIFVDSVWFSKKIRIRYYLGILPAHTPLPLPRPFRPTRTLHPLHTCTGTRPA